LVVGCWLSRLAPQAPRFALIPAEIGDAKASGALKEDGF
jgi:hypothetical protein